MSLRIGWKGEIFPGSFLKVWKTLFYDKKGRPGYWEWTKSSGAVFIFPITAKDEIVLIKNFRVPLERYIIEMPAGVRDKAGETDEELARRELMEETGYRAKNMVSLPHPWANSPGSSNGLSAGFFATELTKTRKKNIGGDTEDITVFTVPMAKLLDLYLNLPKEILFDLRIMALWSLANQLGITGFSSKISDFRVSPVEMEKQADLFIEKMLSKLK